MRHARILVTLLALTLATASAQRDARHWAFTPLPAAVAVPTVRDAAWIGNPIDSFVLARLEREGLAPSPPAPPATRLRRICLTLTGLPPTIDQLQRVTADNLPEFVDACLASAHFGERMASEWLDVARYADTFGYQNDVSRPTWPWRDWVVQAINDNLPFDRFATWQIAGDLLPDASREQRLATAFQRLHRQTNEGGSVEEEMRLEYVADRTQTFATAFLGMTMECARCHDHKFDPVSIRDYYALTAFFDNVDESGLYSHFTRATPTPALSLPTPEQQRLQHTAQQRVHELERRLAAIDEASERRFLGWITDPQRTPTPPPLAHFSFESIVDGQLPNEIEAAPAGRAFDGPRLVDGHTGKALGLSGDNGAKLPKVGDFDRHQPFSLAFWLRVPTTYARAVVLHRSKAWTDAGSRGYELLVEDGQLSFALVHFWPGNAIRVRTDEPFPVGSWHHVALTYDGSSRADGMTILIDGHLAATRIVRDELTRTIGGGGADALTLGQRFRDNGLRGGAIDELSVFDRELTEFEVATLAGVEAKSTQRAARSTYLRAIDADHRTAQTELVAARRALGKIQDAQAEIMVMREMATPRATYVRPRGSYQRRGERVAADTPGCLPALPADAPKNRLTLARWLTAPDHPLTARVAVNRIWQLHFGTGLVATAEDFGTQGAAPTHPRLLDWLARRFVDSGWDQKALHRLIVTSSTFQQSSTASAELLARDPHNRLLARGPRFQLSAEVLRDQALRVSGLLVDRRGGPPVRPYQPAGLWREKSGSTYRQSDGDGLWRRSLYTFWKRTSPPPTMMLLDAGKRDVCAMRRQRTSTPLQALVLMNDPQFVEAARCLAERTLREHPDDDARLRHVFRLLTARLPTATEHAVLAAALPRHRQAFAREPERARALLAVGERAPADGLDAVDVAAMTMITTTLMQHDEVVRQR